MILRLFMSLSDRMLVILPALAWRLLDEERVLVCDLEGCEDYRGEVCFQMIPGIWQEAVRG